MAVESRSIDVLAVVTRKIIGAEFIRVFEEEAAKLGSPGFLVQGTLYSDVIESGGGTGAATIKSHHNVGGLPDDLEFDQRQIIHSPSVREAAVK